MADDFIKIDRTKQHGNQAVRLAGLIQEAQDMADNLEANAQRQWDTGEYTTLETKFGLQAGAGANFLTLLGLVKTALNHADLQQYVARVANQ